MALALAALLAVGCARVEPPVYAPLVERSARRPVVLVPGVTGTKLRDPESGRVLWGRGVDLLKPRDGGYAVARPLAADATGDSGAEPFEVIEAIRLFGGLVRMEIYGPIVRLLEANGYRRGDLTRPVPEADFFLFAYDWRDDLVVSARRLAAQLERLRRARGLELLEVDLICQSAGGQICRYLAKYGGASLESAEARPPEALEAVRVAKAILVGTSNGGSVRILRELDRGRTYVPAVGRKMRPEVLFTFPSLFQDLPVYRDDVFVGADGEPLALDLFDGDVWLRHGFSIFAVPSRRRIERRGREDLFGDAAERRAALDRFLDRARRLHAVLARDAAGFATRYYSIQNVADATPDRAVLLERPAGGWELLYTGDRRLRKRPQLRAAVTAGGDGHAPVASQAWLSPQERAALAAEPLHLRGDHFAMILDPLALERILSYLAD